MAYFNRLVTLRIFVFLIFVVSSGCGGAKSLEESSTGTFHIIIDDLQARAKGTMQLLSDGIDSGQYFTQTAPSTITDINCFAVNVTGVGIAQNNELHDCTSTNNFGGEGIGVFADPVPRGQSVTVTIPSGNSRRIGVFGIYPPVSECTSGSNSNYNNPSGYLIGSTSVNLTDDVSVTIPVSYASGQAADFSCQDYIHLAPSVGTYNSTCVAAAAVPLSPVPVAGIGAGGTTLASFVSATSAVGGTLTYAECNAGGPSEKTYAEFQFNVSGYDLTTYSDFVLQWTGRVGEYNTGCGSANTGTAGGAIYVYRASTSSWETVNYTPSTIGSGTESATGHFNNVSDYITGGYIVVRISTAISPGTPYCLQAATDFIRLSLKDSH